MKCRDCKHVIIGSVPDFLQESRRCKKCHQIHIQKMSAEIKVKQVPEEIKKPIKEEPIDNRFEILDF